MKQTFSKDILLSAFVDAINHNPLYTVEYMYMATADTIQKDIEKHNLEVELENQKHPEWGRNKIEFDISNYKPAIGDKYIVMYNRCITPVNIPFREFVCGFLEMWDDEHTPIGIASTIFSEDKLLERIGEIDYSIFKHWLSRK